jgi:IS1 family transposase
MDRTTRQSIALHGGDRRRDRAKPWWANLPVGSREQAVCSPDQYEVSKGVIPTERHTATTKKARKTNGIERFNTTRRLRISRLVRETLAFSKTVVNDLGAMRYFLCYDNRTRATAFPL